MAGNRSAGLASGAIFALVVIVAANWTLPGWNAATSPADGSCPVSHPLPGVPFACGGHTLAAWLVTVAALIVLLAIAGEALEQTKAGVLIDNRNRISLSKLQMIGWTVLILSGLITVSATMVEGLNGAPASIVLSTPLLSVMGIALGTAAATPALLSVKPDPTAAYPQSRTASWTDLVRGDDESNFKVPDVSKIQQLLITLIVMGIYMAELGNTLYFGQPFFAADRKPNGVVGLPELSDSLIWLIGISHAGYLAYKAAPHTDKDAAGATLLVTGVDGAVG